MTAAAVDVSMVVLRLHMGAWSGVVDQLCSTINSDGSLDRSIAKTGARKHF